MEPGSTIFANSRPAGYTHSIEWQTTTRILLSSFNLFAAGSGATYNNQREFAQFVLRAKARSSDDFTTIYTFTPTHPYTYLDPQTFAIISAQFPEPIEAQFFRAEFVQMNSGRGSDGPRIMEIDGFGVQLPIDNPPIALAQTVALIEDSSTAITLTADDPDGGPAVFEMISDPLDGTLSGTPPNLIYTPNPNFYGTDRLRFRVSSGNGDATSAMVTINVAPLEDLPVAYPITVNASEDQPASFSHVPVDVDGQALTFAIITPLAHGTLTGTLPDFTYTPFPNFSGTDTLRFSVSDGRNAPAEATVSIHVAPINDAPSAASSSVSGGFNEPVAITLSGTDIENFPLAYNILTAPENGTLTGTPPDLTFTPNSDWSGTTSFTYSVSDGELTSDPAAVTITVISPPPSFQSVLHYTFDELSGATVADHSGNGISGTLRNNPAWIPGIIGTGALSFPRSNDHIEIPPHPALDDLELQGGGGMTISFWIHPDALSNHYLFCRGVGSSSTLQISMNTSGRLTFHRRYTGSSQLNLRFDNQVTLGQWQHFVFTWDGSPGLESVRLYRNGVQQTLSFGNAGSGDKAPEAGKPLYLGGTPVSGTNARYDDFRIFNRVLSPAEAAELAATP